MHHVYLNVLPGNVYDNMHIVVNYVKNVKIKSNINYVKIKSSR